MRHITNVTLISTGPQEGGPIAILEYRLYTGKLTELIIFKNIFGGQIKTPNLGNDEYHILELNRKLTII